MGELYSDKKPIFGPLSVWFNSKIIYAYVIFIIRGASSNGEWGF